MKSTNRINFLFLFISIMAAVWNCGRNTPAQELDLTPYFLHFPTLSPVESIEFSHHDFFTAARSGWKKPSRKLDIPYLVFDQSSAELDVFFPDQKKRQIELEYRSDLNITFDIFLNDIPVLQSKLESGRHRLQFPLESDSIRPGVNILSFRLNQQQRESAPKARIAFIHMKISPSLQNALPEIQIDAGLKSIKIKGPQQGYFFFPAAGRAVFRFDYRIQETASDSCRLLLSVSDQDQEEIESQYNPGTQWKSGRIDLSRHSNRLLRLSWTWLANTEDTFELRNPRLEQRDNLKQRPRVLLIGLDGATWDVIDPLIKEGALPNIERLIQNGTRAHLRTIKPWFSPVVWTSIATGKTMDEHGIEGFLAQRRSRETGTPYSRLNRKVKAVWNILSRYGYSIGLISPWVTWPAEKVNGFVLSDRIFFENLDDVTFPAELKTAFHLKIKMEPNPDVDTPFHSLNNLIQPEEIRLRTPVAQNIQNAVHFLERDIWKSRAGLYFNRAYHSDFTFLYLQSPDVNSHFFWKYFKPDDTIPQDEIKAFRDIVPHTYVVMDQIIGHYLSAFGEDTTVVIASDHGMGAKSYAPEVSLINPGQFLHELEIEDSTEVENVGKNQIKFRFSQQTSLLAAGKILSRIKTSGSESAFFQPGEPGPEKILLVEIHPSPHIDGGDNLVVDNRIIGPIEKFFEIQEVSGDHTLDGILIMKGNGIRSQFTLSESSVLDITPTLLYLFGLPKGKDMKGKVLIDAFLPEMINTDRLRPVRSYEGLVDESDGGEARTDREVDQEVIRRLKALGYIK